MSDIKVIDFEQLAGLLNDWSITGGQLEKETAKENEKGVSRVSIYRFQRGVAKLDNMALRHAVKLQEWINNQSEDWIKEHTLKDKNTVDGVSTLNIDEVKAVLDDKSISANYIDTVTRQNGKVGVDRETISSYRNGNHDIGSIRLGRLAKIQKWINERPDDWRKEYESRRGFDAPMFASLQ